MHHHNNNQAIPVGMHVRHMCDNKACVEPAHLQIGTPAENSHDKVTDAIKQAARAIFSSRGSGTRRERAIRFGVSERQVSNIDYGQSWAQDSGYAEANAGNFTEANRQLSRDIYASRGSGTQQERAVRFGVTKSKVSSIDCGTSGSKYSGYDGAERKRKRAKKAEPVVEADGTGQQSQTAVHQ